MAYDFLLYLAINTAVVLVTAPLFISLIKKVKAWTQGRQGPSVFQTYYTIAKLLKKEVIYASTSSRIMRVTPVVNDFLARRSSAHAARAPSQTSRLPGLRTIPDRRCRRIRKTTARYSCRRCWQARSIARGATCR